MPTSRRMTEAATLLPFTKSGIAHVHPATQTYRSTHSFGAQCVVYHHMGHKCLLLQSVKVKVFRTVEVHETDRPEKECSVRIAIRTQNEAATRVFRARRSKLTRPPRRGGQRRHLTDAGGMLSHIKARLVADGSREQGKLPPGEI